MHTSFENLLKEKEKLERELQLKYGMATRQFEEFCLNLNPDAPSLTIRSSPGQAMFVHLAKAKRDKKGLDLDPDFHDLMESGSTKDYFYRASDFSPSVLYFMTSFFFSLGLNLETKLRRRQ